MNEWRVIILRPARRCLARLPAKDRERILQALEDLAADPRRAPGKPLQGRPEWVLRAGCRRIVFRADQRERRLVVISIGPRGDVYR